MMKIFASVFFLIFIVGCGSNKKNDSITSEQEKILGYLPQDSDFLVFMNLNELRNTEFWDNYFLPSLLNQNKFNNSFDNFEEETGVGLNKGISTAVIASSNNNDVFVVRFDKNLDRIKKYFDDNLYKTTLNNRKVYKPNKDSKSFFYFVDDETLIILKNNSYLKNLINGENKSLLNNKNFINIIKGIRNKKHYWVASDEGSYLITMFEKIIGAYKDFPANKLLRSVKNVTMSAFFDDGVDIESDWSCKSPKEAYLLSTAIKGMLAMDLLSKSDYTLGKILQKTEIERNDKLINFQLELNKNDIEDLKDFAKEKHIQRRL